MASYRQQEHAGRLIFVDISNPEFDPAPHGITMDAFMYELHAIDRAGHVYRGVEAFRAIWLAFPASTWYGLLGTLVTLPGVNILARLAYWSFARARKYLPTSSEVCKNGSCRIGQHPPRQ
jgi:predicted DCC family thiol-disulfide oxidoreductase YuxK